MARRRLTPAVALGPDSPLHGLAGPRGCPTEKQEQQWADRFIVGSLGGTRSNFSQARPSMQTPGIPDRRYWAVGLAFWWEMKAEDGRLSPAQDEYLTRELDHGALGGCGTYQDLIQYVEDARAVRSPEVRVALGRQLVAKWKQTPAQRRPDKEAR